MAARPNDVSQASLKIPWELFRPIIEQIGHRNSLYAMALTCSSIRTEAERALYHTMMDPSSKVQDGFLSTIVKDPARGRYVHILDLVNRDRQTLKKVRTLVELLPMALRNMDNLEQFSFLFDTIIQTTLEAPLDSVISINLSPREILRSLENVAQLFSPSSGVLPNLRKLHIESSGVIPDYFIPYINPKLSTLVIISERSTSIKQDACLPALPNLKFLRCGMSMLLSLLPLTTQVEALHLIIHPSGSRTTPTKISPLQPYLLKLKYLSYGDPRYVQTVGHYLGNVVGEFSLLSPHLKNLIYLELFQFKFRDDINSLQSMSSLRMLVIHSAAGMTAFNRTQSFLEARKIFSICPQIRYIGTSLYIESRGIWLVDIFNSTEDGNSSPTTLEIDNSQFRFQHIFEHLPCRF